MPKPDGIRVFFNDHNIEALKDIECHEAAKKPITIKFVQILEDFKVETKEGWMYGKAHDVIIKGISGELYPCDLQIFLKTYDIPSPSGIIFPERH